MPHQIQELKSDPSVELDICYVSTALPRRCGIATFTSDLAGAVSAVLGERPYTLMALSNSQDGADYSPDVRFRIRQKVIRDYSRAAAYINRSSAHVVNLHHEFGIFGGSWGNYVSVLLKCLEKPVVTTCHTIIEAPRTEVRDAFETVLALSERTVTMSPSGVDILKETYRVPEDKISLIDHGIPDLPFVASDALKGGLNLRDKAVLLTFGLHHPNKGIETVLQALPRVLERCPQAIYLVLGETHPEIKKERGESYRSRLERMVRELRLDGNVVFHNRFFDYQELLRYVLASDICITPYLDERQISSGVLALAVGAGKAVVSTHYHYARDLLANGTGVFFKANDSNALAQALIQLIEDHEFRNVLRKKAYQRGRSMVWEAVARQYVHLFEEVKKVKHEQCISVAGYKTRELAKRYRAELVVSDSKTNRRLGRLIDLAWNRQWREIARKVVKNLTPAKS